MEQEIRKILRCPICEKGRIADAPAGAALSQYRLFAMVGYYRKVSKVRYAGGDHRAAQDRAVDHRAHSLQRYGMGLN